VTALGADYVLISDTSDSGNLKKALISDFASAGGDMASATYDPATIAEQLVGLTATQTLTNKTLTSPKINENVAVTSTATELNILDGAIINVTELNRIDGVTANVQTQLNAKAPIANPSFTGEISIVSVSVSETELGILDGATVTTSELNILDGVTSTTAELNILDGVTATTTELNYVDGVTSAIQTQLDAKADTAITINTQTGTTYTLVLTDSAKMVTLNNASAVTMTVPPNSSVAYATGTQIAISALGAGQVTVAQGSGVTVRTAETLKLRDQYSGASLLKIGTDEWLLVGDLEAA